MSETCTFLQVHTTLLTVDRAEQMLISGATKLHGNYVQDVSFEGHILFSIRKLSVLLPRGSWEEVRPLYM